MSLAVLAEADHNWVSGGWGGATDRPGYHRPDSEVCTVDNDCLYTSVPDHPRTLSRQLM